MSKKTPLSRVQKYMNILGWFHFGFAAVAGVPLILLIIGNGVELVGVEIKKTSSPVFESLKAYSNDVAGLAVIILLAIFCLMELFIGWSCRRRARRPEKVMFTIVLTGLQILFSIVSILQQGFVDVQWSDTGYSLALNGITFALAMWMWMELKQKRRRLKPS